MLWIERVRRTGELSDLTVVVDGMEFHLHSLPLMAESAFFRRRLLRGSRDGESWSGGHSLSRVELSLIGGAPAFEAAIDYCYFGNPNLKISKVASIRAMAEQLEMPALLEATSSYLYDTVFKNWRSSSSFLRFYRCLGCPSVDEYIQSCCIKAISAAFSSVAAETSNLSAPFPSPPSSSQLLTEILAKVASLPNSYAAMAVDELVDGKGAEIRLECRQSRNARSWLDNLINSECRNHSSKCWVIVCLTRMLKHRCSREDERPWLQLSSQYWCGLLEHGRSLFNTFPAVAMLKKNDETDEASNHEGLFLHLQHLVSFLEHRIGSSLHELDDYLHSFTFDPPSLISMITHFRSAISDLDLSEAELQEVAEEIDSCLWKILNHTPPIPFTATEFTSLIDFFPPQARRSHDTLYIAIETLTRRSSFTADELQNLWRSVDVSKLSQPVYCERALNNDAFLSHPQVLQFSLQKLNEELIAISTGTDRNLKLNETVQRVIKASLKLVEENNQRSREMAELKKKHYPTTIQNLSLVGPLTGNPMLQDEVEVASDDQLTLSRQSCSSTD